MILTIERKIFTAQSTISPFKINGVQECWILEDPDRELDAAMPITEILAKKIPGHTAIPYGRYRLTVSWSPRFNRDLPLINAVPGFIGIRIHPGNRPEHTEGCPLPGENYAADTVYHSQRAFNKFFPKINAAFIAGEELWIEVTRSNGAMGPAAGGQP